MTFSPKTWHNSPTADTPLDAAGLIDLETRLAAYTDAERAALAALVVPLTQKGAVNGVAPLNGSGLIDSGYLPAATGATRVVDTPEAHGAVGNGRLLSDVSITSGSATLTSASAGFVAGDVGKTIMVMHAGPTHGSTQECLITTISARVSATQVTLAATASASVTGGNAIYGTDDTAAIKAAVDAAVATALAIGSYYAEVQFSSKFYMLAGATTKSSTYKGNAQVPLPLVPDTGRKLHLVFKGMEESAGLLHWNQTVPQLSGACLISTNASSYDATWGNPAVIGGPTPEQGFGSPDTLAEHSYTNVYLRIDGVQIVVPLNPKISGADLRGVAEANIVDLCVMAFCLPGSVDFGANASYAATTTAFGLAMPETGNNAKNVIDEYSCQGHYIGLYANEHCTGENIICIFCVVGVSASSSDAGVAHHMVMGKVNVYECQVGLSSGNAGFPCKIKIAMLDDENCNFALITDPTDKFTGEVVVGTTASNTLEFGTGGPARINGARNLRVIDANRIPGWAGAPPAVPATGVTLQNPYFHDAAVTVKGGTITDIEIDGHSIGVALASGATHTLILPTMKTIKLIYTGTPTWVWNLL